MARHKQFDAVEEENASLDISSLIDVTFLLLIYFLVSSAIQIRETDLTLKLPELGKSPPAEVSPLLIKVDAAGQISVGDSTSTHQLADDDPDSRSLPLLSQFVGMWSAANQGPGSKPLVHLWADNDARQQRVIDVLNVLALYRIESVTFTDGVE